jgi:hypothetical protein
VTPAPGQEALFERADVCPDDGEDDAVAVPAYPASLKRAIAETRRALFADPPQPPP